MKNRISTFHSLALGLLSVFLLNVPDLQAQFAQNYSIRNKYAGVTVDGISGQIVSIVKYDPNSYYGSDTSGLICISSETSHANFYFTSGSNTPLYITNYSNNNSRSEFFEYDRSTKPPTKIYSTYADSVYIEGDSIIAEWRLNNVGYDIKQYTYPFLTNSSGSIAIEYRAVQTDVNTANSLSGILLELDNDIESGSGTPPPCNNYTSGGDNAPILDSRELEEQLDGTCFVPVSQSYIGSANVPQWFQSANSFNYDPSAQTVALGNLQNPSVVPPGNGPILTPPDEFYIGDLSINASIANGLKNVTWVVDTPDFYRGNFIYDAAMIYKWNVRSMPFRCCTSFGPDDPANENYNCLGNDFWLNFRFPDESIKNPAGVLALPIDTIQLWTTNVSLSGQTEQSVVATIDTTNTCFVLLPGQSLTQKVLAAGQTVDNLSAWSTGYCQWLVRSDTSRCCQLGDTSWIDEPIKVTVTSAQDPNWNSPAPCQPSLAVYCYKCSIDLLPPLITYNGLSGSTFTWTVRDGRHCDLGISSINVLNSTNFNITWTPDPFPSCDTNAITITGAIVDTTQPGQMTVQIIDCNNNADTINEIYTAAFDKLPPYVQPVSQTDLAIGSSTTCTPNYECTSVNLLDNPKPPVSGIGVVTVLDSSNFTITGLSPNRGAPNDLITACVRDTFLDANLIFTASDVAGNTMLSPDTITYCTLQDTLPPVITGGLNGETFSYRITEQRPWDRGLLDVNVTNPVNVTVNGPTFFGDTLATLTITVIDTSANASFCIVARDSFFVDSADIMQFGGGDSNHTSTICAQYTTGVDTMPPNIWWVTNPANPAQATIFANDIHYLQTGSGDSILYANDKNLNRLYFVSDNDVDTIIPFIATCVTKDTSWVINVLDTLSLTDTQACFVIAASDCQPNLTVAPQWCYSINPDNVPPLLHFSHLGVTRDTIYFTAVDSGAYARGLDSIYLTNFVNMDSLNATMNGARGIMSDSFFVHIRDTSKPASACINVMNLWTATHPSVQATQITQGCFSTYVAPVWLDTLAVVENGYQFSIPVHIRIDTVSEQIKSVDFSIHYPDGIISFNGVTGTNGIIPIWNDLGSNNGIHTYSIQLSGPNYVPVGLQTIWSLEFTAATIADIGTSNVWIDSSSVGYNQYQTTNYYESPFVSMPNLAPFATVLSGDSVYVSGECQQILLLQSGAPLDLSQNIPNPFSKTTAINYSLDRAGMMDLTLYNSIGIPVATLVHGVEKPGAYQVTYDATLLKPGVYYYCLNAGGAMRAKTMVIIR